jgi:hypothetical protein
MIIVVSHLIVNIYNYINYYETNKIYNNAIYKLIKLLYNNNLIFIQNIAIKINHAFFSAPIVRNILPHINTIKNFISGTQGPNDSIIIYGRFNKFIDNLLEKKYGKYDTITDTDNLYYKTYKYLNISYFRKLFIYCIYFINYKL